MALSFGGYGWRPPQQLGWPSRDARVLINLGGRPGVALPNVCSGSLATAIECNNGPPRTLSPAPTADVLQILKRNDVIVRLSCAGQKARQFQCAGRFLLNLRVLQAHTLRRTDGDCVGCWTGVSVPLLLEPLMRTCAVGVIATTAASANRQASRLDAIGCRGQTGMLRSAS